MERDIKIDIIEYESDREISQLELEPSEFDLADKNSVIDIISWFFTHQRALAATLLISNFELAIFELQYNIEELVLKLGLGSSRRLEQLQKDAIINSEALNTACNAEILKKTEGKTTFISNQRHHNIPVYSISSNQIFKASIISAFLLFRFGRYFEFPQRTDANLDSLFRTQLQLLSLLDRDTPRALNILDRNFKSRLKRPINKTTLLDLSTNLHRAGFIERIGELISISATEFSNANDRTIFRTYIEELMGSNTHIQLSYNELRRYLVRRSQADNNRGTDLKFITQNVSKYLKRLRKESRIVVHEVKQKFEKSDLGRFGKTKKYVLTPDGELFLDLVRNLVENPTGILGQSSDFFIHDDTSLKSFNNLSYMYQLLIIDCLNRLFQ